jgi:hypothetical protein
MTCHFLFCAAVLVSAAAPSFAQPAKPLTTGVAAFNMGWAGTPEDFKKHVEVCNAPEVRWCDTRARIERGATAPTEAERLRADKCQAATLAAAGGREASMLVVPCNAYRSVTPPIPGQPRPDPGMTLTPAAYQEKLDGLRATVEGIIENEAVKVIAFQEVRGTATVKLVLGKFADRFDVCEARHNAFQTLAFAWDKSVTSKPGVCATHAPLAVLDPPGDPAAFRRVRPGLTLELVMNGAPVTFMNVHLKAGCASVNDSNPRFPGRLLTDAADACEVLNRQVPILEEWVDAVAAKSPRLVLLGDYNRRIDDEDAMNPPAAQVRADGTNPAGPNKIDDKGKVTTKFLWQEIADGAPVLHQVPLSTKEGGCTGFQGLDHIVVSDAIKKQNPGVIFSKKVAVAQKTDQRIETSDHCPRVAQMRF